MKLLLLIILVFVIVFGLYYYRYDTLPFEFSLPPSAVCDDIVERESPEIIETATSVSVAKTEYLDGVRFFFDLCFLR